MTGRSNRSGPGRLVAVVALAVFVLAVGMIVLNSRDGGDRQSTRSPGTTTPNRTTIRAAPESNFTVPPTASGLASVSPVAQRRFIRIGETEGDQFSPAEFKYLAENFGIVLLAKFHGNWVIGAQHEVARKLKAIRPDVVVFPYFSTKYWFDTNRWGVEPKPEWFLRDTAGNLVKKQRGGEDQDEGTYVDLSNPEYRDWALGVMASWLKAAPYSGISFDAADPIGDFPEKQVAEWADRIGSAKVRAYNDGLRDLLRRADVLTGPDRAIVFNGFSQNAIRGPERDLDLLEFTDGALNERFCLDRKGEIVDIRIDLDLLAQHPRSLMMVRTNIPRHFTAPERAEAARFCTAAFLLGWQPGRNFFQFALSYNASQLVDETADQRVDLGPPSSPATWKGAVGSRRFESGAVVVNTGDVPATIEAPVAGSVQEGGKAVRKMAAGDKVELPAGSALILRSGG